jgi:hypothetical protein
MAEQKKITKRQFDKVYGKYLPNGWIKFAFKYFSKSTEKENMSLRNNVMFFLGGLFLLGFFGTVFNAAPAFIAIVTITYSILLAGLVLYLLSAVLLNNKRIKKISKELDIDIAEYNRLVRKFYP